MSTGRGSLRRCEIPGCQPYRVAAHHKGADFGRRSPGGCGGYQVRGGMLCRSGLGWDVVNEIRCGMGCYD